MCDMDVSIDEGYDCDSVSDVSEDIDYAEETDFDSYENIDYEGEVELENYENVDFDDCAAVELLDDFENTDFEYDEDINCENHENMEFTQGNISEYEEENVESEDWMTLEGFENLIQEENDVNFLSNLRDSLLEGEISVKDVEEFEEDSPKVLTREFVQGVQENFEYGNNIESEMYEDSDFLQENISEYMEESIETEDWMTLEGYEELIKDEADIDFLNNLRDALISGDIPIKDSSEIEEDSPKILTREFAQEVQEGSNSVEFEDCEGSVFFQGDISEDVKTGDWISVEGFEETVEEENDVSEIIQETPEYEENTEFDNYMEKELMQEDISEYEEDDVMTETLDLYGTNNAEAILDNPENKVSEEAAVMDSIENETEETFTFENEVKETEEIDINYDEIYDEIQQEALEQAFAEINIDADPERLEQALDDFEETIWGNLSLGEQKESMEKLYDYISDCVGFENPPKIEYYNSEQEGEYGGYNSATNTLRINEHMLYNSIEAADTIAHELWHAHQHERAMKPQNARDFQYQYNFENYITPELGQKEYESQLIEAEARAFAAQFKDRLSKIRGNR